MSRRSVLWKKKAKQAGGAEQIGKLMPRHAVGTGRWQMHGPCVASGWRKSGIVGDGHVCTRDISTAREQVVRRAVGKK